MFTLMGSIIVGLMSQYAGTCSNEGGIIGLVFCGYLQGDFIGNAGSVIVFYGFCAILDVLVVLKIYPVMWKYLVQFFGKRGV